MKKCQKHGCLGLHQVIKAGFKHGIQQWKCKLCQKESHRKHYLENKKQINEKTSAYKKAHREQYKEYNRNWWRLNGRRKSSRSPIRIFTKEEREAMSQLRKIIFESIKLSRKKVEDSA